MFSSFTAAVLQPYPVGSIANPWRIGSRKAPVARSRSTSAAADALSCQNALKRFDKNAVAAFAACDANLHRAVFYTPPMREEVTVQNSCAFPSSYDAQRDFGVYQSPFLRRSVTSFIQTGSPGSRGFRTKASVAREELSTKKEKMALGSIGIKKVLDQGAVMKEILNRPNLSVDERQRLCTAFTEGYLSSSDAKRRSYFPVMRALFWAVLLVMLVWPIMGGSIRRVVIGSANEVLPEEIEVSFADVKGVDEAKQELEEVVEFLKNPEKFTALGGKLPKGVLLVGPPGTGKTLLARAVAGEAGVPFYHAAGPEFDEILVGQGARRVRDLFQTAKARAPCVIFIDEIDSVGAKRTSSSVHPYANQTINQLLSEMDGFHQNDGVIVLGATNRREDLDRALLRPGRFDVEVRVPAPDVVGRKDILQLYLSKVKLAKHVSVDYLAKGTTGFTGADLESMVNQAALKAVLDGAETVTMEHLEFARDKLLMGPERKSRIPDEDCNTITAYHEGGHALVNHFTKDSKPLHKITIVARGQSLGHTSFMPLNDSYFVTKSQLQASLDALMGGRAAEEMIFGPDRVTSGATSDFKAATDMATMMVKQYGMSEKVGVRTFFDDGSNPNKELSNVTSEAIDSEIKRILNEAMERAKGILKTHQRELKLVAEALLKYETLDAKDLQTLLDGGEIKR